MAKILVVDDERSIVEAISYNLRKEGYEVMTAADAQECVAVARRQVPDLVLLDIMLPSGSGLDLCRRLHQHNAALPVLLLTARAAEADCLLGFDAGADDYVVKPFGFRELVARIRAVLRRSATQPSAAPGPQVIGELEIDRRTHRVLLAGEEVQLTPKEYDLLALLALDPGAMVTRREILAEVWDPHWYGTSKTVDVHIASIRKKLGDPKWIETSRGVGFRLAVPQ